jgi:tetratricopeptide (TPR) repeat protein
MLLMYFCFAVCGAQFSFAASNDPTTWWPDPKTGLMWAGRTHGTAMNWKEANDYCASLQLGGYSGWRLPTVEELNAIIYLQPEFTNSSREYEAPEFKGGIEIGTFGFFKWTSTLNGDGSVMVCTAGVTDPHGVLPKLFQTSKPTASINRTALCTRPMEPDLLQLAKDAQANRPVPDVLTLKAYIPLNKARLAYQAGQYQESIAQAKNALLVKPDFAPAYWAIGISYGMSGQWDLAITNLEAALKIDKDYGDTKDALKWAKEGQSAAKKGKSPKAQSPQWD